MQIGLVTLETCSIFAGLGKLCLMFGLEFVQGCFETFGLVLVLVGRFPRCVEKLGESFVFGLEVLSCALGVGELCTKFLESGFKVLLA